MNLINYHVSGYPHQCTVQQKRRVLHNAQWISHDNGVSKDKSKIEK